jgi:hypothetical protein
LSIKIFSLGICFDFPLAFEWSQKVGGPGEKLCIAAPAVTCRSSLTILTAAGVRWLQRLTSGILELPVKEGGKKMAAKIDCMTCRKRPKKRSQAK